MLSFSKTIPRFFFQIDFIHILNSKFKFVLLRIFIIAIIIPTTYSSNGVIHAVANALEIPEDQYAPRPGRNLTAKKKNHGHIVKHEITSQEEYEEKVEKYSK